MSVTLDTEFGLIDFSVAWSTFSLESQDMDWAVEIEVPDARTLSVDELADGVMLIPPRRYGGFDAADSAALIRLLQFAQQLAELLNEANATRIESAQEAARKLEEEREREEKERAATIADRKERLMVEFIGEEIKIRERGYQTMRRAIVEVQTYKGLNDENESHRLYFNYLGRGVRTQAVEYMKRVDIKVGSHWETIWDDGTDDLKSYEPLSSSAKPTGRVYD